MKTSAQASILVFLTVVCLAGQGVVSRGVKPVPRGEPSGLPFHAKFTDVAAEAGLRMPVIYGGVDYNDYILETVGSGAAFFDYDNDGWIDIFLPSGTRRKNAPEGAINRLYQNKRDGTFRDVTASSGLGRSGWASSVTVGDYDDDGDEDLFVTNWGKNALYRNEGQGKFSEVTEDAGLLHEGTRWGAGSTFIDYDRDGHLDLFVANYLEFDFETTPGKGTGVTCRWKGVPVNCGPRGLPTARQYLYRNQGDGTFRDVSESSGIAQAPEGYAMTAVAADFDGDRWTDIYVACDSTASLFFRNNRDGTFAEEGLERGAALSDDGMEQAGMGVGVGDYDLDGDLDIFKTHFADDTNVLYRNDGDGNFSDVTVQAGLGVETRFVGWGAAIVDLDNNGLPDLFYVTGSVYPEVEKELPHYPYHTPRVIFRNLGEGKFEELIGEAGPGIDAAHTSRGAAFGDYDNDGDIDVLIVNLNQPPSLLRNDLDTDDHWLKVKLIGVASNRSAIGASVKIRYADRQQVQAVLAQDSFYSVSDRRLHFGLGEVDKADLEVRWPKGSTETFKRVAVSQLVTIREGQGIVSSEKMP